MKITADVVEKICQRLLSWDQEIVEIIQFGSSVYSPQQARDLDILVFTKKKKEYFGYLDRLDELDLPFDIDVVVHEKGASLESGFACHVLGAYEILYGDGSCLRAATQHLGNPTFEEAFSRLRGARRHMELARIEQDELDKDREIRDSFNSLFHAARVASMVFLSIGETRWGKVRKSLPPQYQANFKEFIDVLHIEYFYRGRYPREKVEEDFQKWFERVEKYVRELAEKGKGE